MKVPEAIIGIRGLLQESENRDNVAVQGCTGQAPGRGLDRRGGAGAQQKE
jgi:hypothetical protein